jgi:hypothetical protein
LALFLLVFYFFVFDFVTGFYLPAVTCGLLILAGMVFLVADTIFMVRHERQKRGMRGFAFGCVVFVYTSVMIIFFSGSLIGTPGANPASIENTEEHKVITLALKKVFGLGLGYDIISPYTDVMGPGYSETTPVQINSAIRSFASDRYKDGIFTFKTKRGSLSIKPADFDRLLNEFDMENSTPAALAIPSSAGDGYYIDYDNRYTPDIWYPSMVWRIVHPSDVPYTRMLMPVYDEDSGLVMVYYGTESDDFVYILKYENGTISGYIECKF